ncbi:MAG TPA: hypothetical protein VE243_04095, partial [Candidatus Acidoferrum sp.]|nr:hypothetical protein [Candidatus Acidoferrum sp.]
MTARISVIGLADEESAVCFGVGSPRALDPRDATKPTTAATIPSIARLRLDVERELTPLN